MYVTNFVVSIYFYVISNTCLTPVGTLSSISCVRNELLRLIKASLSYCLHISTLLIKNLFTWFWIPLRAEVWLVICLICIGKAISSWVILGRKWLSSRFGSVVRIRSVISRFLVPWSSLFYVRTVSMDMNILWRDEKMIVTCQAVINAS